MESSDKMGNGLEDITRKEQLGSLHTEQLKEAAHKIAKKYKVFCGFIRGGYYFRTSNEEKRENIREEINDSGYSSSIERVHNGRYEVVMRTPIKTK